MKMIRILKTRRKTIYKTRYEKRAFTMYKRNKKIIFSLTRNNLLLNSLKKNSCPPQQASSISDKLRIDRSIFTTYKNDMLEQKKVSFPPSS